MLGFDEVDRAFEAGYNDSIGQLREWLQSAERELQNQNRVGIQ